MYYISSEDERRTRLLQVTVDIDEKAPDLAEYAIVFFPTNMKMAGRNIDANLQAINSSDQIRDRLFPPLDVLP